MIVVIPCGRRKAPSKCPAGKIYTGPYYRTCLAYARSLVESSSIYILSAKYGLLSMDQEIEPYNLKMGDPGCVSVKTVLLQAASFKLLNESVVGLGGKEYIKVMRVVWPKIELPVPNLTLGKQLSWLKAHTPRVPQEEGVGYHECHAGDGRRVSSGDGPTPRRDT